MPMTTTDPIDSGFTVSVAQHKYLAPRDHHMDAMITVTAAGLGRSHDGGGGPAAAEVILVDCSGSMAERDKITAARHATRAAIDVLRDGVLFAVVQGRNGAEVVYPRDGRLIAASRTTRAEAKAVVQRLAAAGGTAFGTWLSLAHELLRAHPTAIRHAMLFTDGKNESERPEQLDRVLDTIRGRFTCDARGIGDRWQPSELLRIVGDLNGQAAGVVRLEDMADDFRAVMLAAMRKAVPDVDLRIRLFGNARLSYLKQTFPTGVDLTGQLRQPDEMTAQVAIGAWADETREYRLGIGVDFRGRLDEDTLAALVELDVHRSGETGAAEVKPGLVLVRWTTDGELSTRGHDDVIRADLQQRLTDEVLAGCDAFARREWTVAETRFGHAVRLASELDHDHLLRRLSAVVDIVDAAAGKVRLRTEVSMTELLALEASSTQSSRRRSANPIDGSVPGAEPVGPPRVCADCGRTNDGDANRCEQCGRRLDPGDTAAQPS
jgi:Ca-activated chloride channel family protein